MNNMIKKYTESLAMSQVLIIEEIYEKSPGVLV